MAEVECEIHGFSHFGYRNTTITSLISSYSDILMKINVKGVIRYGRLLLHINTNYINGVYLFEMDIACPDGYNNANHKVLTCEDRRGVLLRPSFAQFCLTSVHQTLETFFDKVINEDCVCCIKELNELPSYPSFTIGSKFILKRNILQSNVGICKWIGKINNIECIGAEMIDWQSNGYTGLWRGLTSFDCREGHGIFLKCSDVEIATPNPDHLEFNEHGFVYLRNIYQVAKSTASPKDMLKIGRRVQLLLHENRSNRYLQYNTIFGLVKWVGTINKGKCVGIELDYPCEGSMDGNIDGSESFGCESGHGAVCPINCVTLDYYIYSAEFTVSSQFNIDGDLKYNENWSQKIVYERDLKINNYIYVYIDKNDRILHLKGLLKWFGYIQGVLVGVLEMPDNFPITTQQKITHMLKEFKPVSHIIVHSQYLFKYKTLKSYDKPEYIIHDFDVGKKTDFGIVRWKGVDENECPFYGFEMESISDTGSDGTFCGQRLFQCNKGLGVIVSARSVYESINYTTTCSSNDQLVDETMGVNTDLSSSNNNADELITLLSTMANTGVLSPEILLSSAMEMENKTFLGSLVGKMTCSLSIFKNTEVVTQLLKARSFTTLQIAVDKCPIADYNNIQLLKVAAESLKFGELALFETCMKKCTNKYLLMENGETLITQIIKEKVDQSVIVRVIESYEFDMTQPNTDKCIPLTLACGNMMMDVVDCIVQTIKKQDIKKKVCAICMDRNIGTVFNCGHNSCKECSENISSCHLCNEKIVTRGVLYLN